MKYILLSVALITSATLLQAQTNFGKEWVVGFGGYMIKFDNPILHDTLHKSAYFDKGSSNICDSLQTLTNIK